MLLNVGCSSSWLITLLGPRQKPRPTSFASRTKHFYFYTSLVSWPVAGGYKIRAHNWHRNLDMWPHLGISVLCLETFSLETWKDILWCVPSVSSMNSFPLCFCGLACILVLLVVTSGDWTLARSNIDSDELVGVCRRRIRFFAMVHRP